MHVKKTIVAALIAVSTVTPAAAHDSVQQSSAVSVAVSMVAAVLPAWAAHQGSQFTVRAVKATASGVELSLRGASGAIETSALVARDVAEAASIGIGTSVQVVAESTGYALIASGTLLAFVPNELGRALLHHARH